MTRGNARELAVHLIYSRGFTGETPEEILAARLDKAYYATLEQDSAVYTERPHGAQRQYIEAVVSGTAQQEEVLNGYIQKFSIGWDVSRITRLIRSILQLSIYEILFVKDVPTNVAISEAVRLSKLYDGDDAGSFVNGILGSFARSLAAEEVK